MPFQIAALPAELFAPYFSMGDVALANAGARHVIAGPGSPCRVSLVDAEPGETLLLINYQHQPADTPFRASHAIYVRKGAQAATLAPGELPPVMRSRVMSLRAFDAGGMLVGGRLASGSELSPAITALLAEDRTAYLHAHYAAFGCYAARIDPA
jgi:hypothetical protein